MPEVMDRLRSNAADRGRDGGRTETYDLPDGRQIVLGNWRATPTPEVQHGLLQPYDGIVHNGTISNDKELGAKDGEIDSEVLPRVINRESVHTIAESLSRVKGSYALGIRGVDTLFLACNYKPLYYYATGVDNDTVYFSSMERHFEGVIKFGHSPKKLAPYSVLDLTTGNACEIPRTWGRKALVVASAGLDSTVVATKLVREGYTVCLLHFRYGCHAQPREETCIRAIASQLGCGWSYVDIPYHSMRGDSPLLSTSPRIAQGAAGAEYAHEWVPARNLVMLSLAVAYAEANGYHVVALGNNLEESGAYPDNEEEFTHLLNGVMPYATQNGYRVDIISPVGHLMKHEIVKLGQQLNTPFHYTWSCYKGGTSHCGECGPCFMRKTAFERNGLKDPVMS